MSESDATPMQERVEAARLRALRVAFRRLNHEIRGSLNEIVLKVEVARAELAAHRDPDVARDILAKAAAASHPVAARLETLERLLRPPSPEIRTFDVSEVLEEIRDLLKPAAADRQVEVAVRWSRVTLRASRDACAAALLHVGVSALDALPQGGRMEMLPRRDGDQVSIRFTGEPPGSAPPPADDAWPFVRHENQPANATALLVARHLVAEVGGEFETDASDPGGPTCTVRLPAHPPEGRG